MMKAGAAKLGIGAAETVWTWVRKAEVDAGRRPGVTSGEAAGIKRLRAENAEMRRANETLRVTLRVPRRHDREAGGVGRVGGGVARRRLGPLRTLPRVPVAGLARAFSLVTVTRPVPEGPLAVRRAAHVGPVGHRRRRLREEFGDRARPPIRPGRTCATRSRRTPVRRRRPPDPPASPGGVTVQELPGAETARRDTGPELADHGVVVVDERHGDDPARRLGRVHEELRIRRDRRDGFLAHDVLAGPQAATV
ncbi:hypothetical protein GCM10010276_86550 [Streptomyces longisporus]|uniref:Transposase n=1 Tax=Streptomyces longisporus TaxID=1948 RepID=A0ABP6ATE3_STRLO